MTDAVLDNPPPGLATGVPDEAAPIQELDPLEDPSLVPADGPAAGAAADAGPVVDQFAPRAEPLEPLTLSNDAFCQPSLQKVQASLEMLVGKPITIQPGALETGDAAAAVADAPAHTVVLTAVATGVAAGRIAILLDRRLALVLAAHMQIVPDAAVRARLSELDTTGLTDAERDTLGDIGSFIVASLAEQAQLVVGQKLSLASGPITHHDGGMTVGGEQPVDAGTVVRMVAQMSVDGCDAAPLALVLPLAIAQALLPAMGGAASVPGGKGGASASATTGKPAAAAHGAKAAQPSVAGRASAPVGPARKAPPAAAFVLPAGASCVVVGAAPFFASMGERVPAGCDATSAASVADLLAGLEAGMKPAVVVVDIAGGHEHLIELLGAIRRHPAMRRTALVGVLENPTRKYVLRCGSNGILHVLPAGADAQAVALRLEALVRKHAPLVATEDDAALAD